MKKRTSGSEEKVEKVKKAKAKPAVPVFDEKAEKHRMNR